jgi:hypothetical protein
VPIVYVPTIADPCLTYGHIDPWPDAGLYLTRSSSTLKRAALKSAGIDEKMFDGLVDPNK